MPPIIIALTLLLAAPSGASTLRTVWESCLQSYAQIESAGSNSNITIAVNARAACSAERDQYTNALRRESASDPSPSVTSDERVLTIRLIAFLRRIRER
jgi:hypothetical protein